MAGRSDRSCGPDGREEALDGLARAATAKGVSRRQLVKLGGAFALAAMHPRWAQPAYAGWKREARVTVKPTHPCAAQPRRACPQGSLRGDWTSGCKHPVANGKRSGYNGCGPQGGIFVPVAGKGDYVPDQPLHLANFFDACKGHDCCYGTCGSKKSQCDQDFFQHMVDACSAAHGGASPGLIDGVEQSYCLEVAFLYYKAVSSTDTGQQAYEAAQKDVCDCCVDCQEQAKVEGYLDWKWRQVCPDPNDPSGYSCVSVCGNSDNCGACGNKCKDSVDVGNGQTTYEVCWDEQCVVNGSQGGGGYLDYCTDCQHKEDCHQ